MKTIIEIYEEIKQKLDKAKIELNKIYGKANDFLKDFDFKSGVDVFMKNSQLVGEVNAYADVVALIEQSGVLEDEKLKDMALELACENIRDMYCSDYCVCTRDEKRCKGRCCYEQYYDKEKILNQAKEKLEKENSDE